MMSLANDKQDKNSSYYAYGILSLIAIAFGIWFACKQVHAVSALASIKEYPLLPLLLTVLRCGLTIIAWAALSHLILTMLSKQKFSSLCTAVTFIPLILVWGGCSLLSIVLLILALQLVFLLRLLQKEDYRWLRLNYGMDAVALVIFFLLHLLLTTRYSPLHGWTGLRPIEEELPFLAPLFNSFIAVKQFSFSAIDYTSWAGVLNPPVPLSSAFLEIVTFILNLPSLSVETFRAAFFAISFTLVILGSFGAYLFLKYAARTHVFFALIGGGLFFFSNGNLVNDMMMMDGNIFLPVYSTFPYALLFISKAFENKDYKLACWAGVALASQFFFLVPHPEATIYGLLFYGVYAFGLLLFSRGVAWGKRIMLILASIVVFFLLSAFSLLPILFDSFTGNMHTLAHLKSGGVAMLENFIPLMHQLALFLPVSFILLWHQSRLGPVYLSTAFLSLFLWLFTRMLTSDTLNNFLASHLHLALHIGFPWRYGIFYGLAIVFLVMIALDAITRCCLEFVEKKCPDIAGAPK